MNKLIFTFIIACSFSLIGQEIDLEDFKYQNEDSKKTDWFPKSKGFTGKFGLQIEPFSDSDFINSLGENYTSDPNITFSSNGFGAFFMKGLVIGGGSSEFLNTTLSSSNTENLSISGRYSYGTIGKAILSSKRSFLFANANIGLLNKDYLLQDNQATNFQNLASGNYIQNNINARTLVSGFELNYAYFLSKKGKAGLFLSLTAGYRLVLNETEWTINEQNIVGAPEMNGNSYYGKVGIGFGFVK